MGRLATIFLASLLLVLPCEWVHGQQPKADDESQETSRDNDERRVRRLGDVDPGADDFDLSVPTMRPAEPESADSGIDLGDEELEQRLETALGILAIRQGDRQAQEEVEIVLDEVLRRADRAMNNGDYDGARDLLNAVRQVEPNNPGLTDAWARLATLQRPDASASRSATVNQSEKLGRFQSSTNYDLPNPAQAERLDQLLSMLAARPGSPGPLNELDALLSDLLAQARTALGDGDFTTASELLTVVRSVNPRKRGLSETVRLFQQSTEIDQWLEAAREAERQGALVEPRLESAYYWYRRVLSLDQDNQDALRGLRGIQDVMIVYAIDAAKDYDFELSEAWLREAETIIEDQSAVIRGREEVQAFRDETAAGFEKTVMDAIRAGDYNLAEFNLIDLIALGGYEDRVIELRALMNREEDYGAFEPGDIIQDAFTDGRGTAPTVVVITAGSFMMGSRDSERDRTDAEGPQHRVTFERGFGLGREEVSVGDFARFVEATGYRTEAERRGGSSVWNDELGQLSERSGIDWRYDFTGEEAAMDLPVVHVSWTDAVEYVEWLSAVTGESYRLPSEAEFEYVIRAGSRSPYWWGDSRPGEELENLAGQNDTSPTGRRFSNYFRSYRDGHFGPAPVASFAVNPWGIYDLAGNVSEWTQDCWHSSYMRAPVNGLPWENPGCTRRVVRGGYWASAPRQARSAARMSAPPTLRTPQLGFRIARDLW